VTTVPTSGGASDLSTLRVRLDSLRTEAGIPGLAVAVVHRGESLGAFGLGTADIQSGRPVTGDTPFNIASVSKPISAVVAMRLRELGLLDLDAPLTGYKGFAEFCVAALERGGLFFGDWSCADPSLTMRHVLTMTSNGVPGTRFFYNPVAFSWMSRPMAEVGGAAFSDLVATHVFHPAGMIRSARRHRDLPLRTDLERDLAQPHVLASNGYPARSDPPPPQGDGAAGGVIATASDLARFDISLDSNELVSESSRAEMWDPAAPGVPYGIGWFVDEVLGEQAVWHTGLWEGAYSALYLKVLSRDATLILLANSDGLRWPGRLDEAGLERSPFARAFFEWLASLPGTSA